MVHRISIVFLLMFFKLFIRGFAQNQQPLPVVPHIAIIGAGIGGSTTSLYISKLFGKDDADIDIYERNAVGGRAAVIQVGDTFFEAGASIIHSRNRYLSDLAKDLGLKHRSSNGGRLAIYNGKEYVFTESEYKWVTYAELLWRYGWSLFRWDNLIDNMLLKFDRIYEHQGNGHAFTSVNKLLSSMDPSFVNLTQMNISEFLYNMKFSSKFIDELATAVTRVNYGQTTNINGFVGAVALSAAQASLWAVEGGNYKLAEGALKKSDANLIRGDVESISLKDGKYILLSTYFDENNQKKSREKTYDIVIISAPQTKDFFPIKFKDFPHIHKEFPGHYHRTVATFIKGRLNGTHFGFQDADDVDIITTDTKIYYNSISKNHPVKAAKVAPSVWKVFSQKPLNKKDLDVMFCEITAVEERDWLAYPEYQPPQELGQFQLHDRLYYTSTIEWAASAMEMSAVAGKNAALLAYNQWFQKEDKIDQILVSKEPPMDINVNDEL